LHITNHGYDRITSVPGHAKVVHFKGSCLHFGLFGVLQTEPGGIATHLDANQRVKGN